MTDSRCSLFQLFERSKLVTLSVTVTLNDNSVTTQRDLGSAGPSSSRRLLSSLEPAPDHGGITTQELGDGHGTLADGLDAFDLAAAVAALHAEGLPVVEDHSSKRLRAGIWNYLRMHFEDQDPQSWAAFDLEK